MTAISLDGITLPADLQWPDEFNWSGVRQRIETTLSGALVVEDTSQTKGRPITLEGGQNAAWVKRSTVKALHTIAQVASAVYVLDYHGTTYNVMFNQAAGPISAEEVQRLANPDDDHLYTLTLRLFEV